MRKDEEPIVAEETFDVPVETVWDAITKVDLMRQWYFDNIPAFEAEVGFETRFDVQSEGRNFLHIWRVKEAVPNRKLTYSWRFQEYPGDSDAVWELFEENGGTRLRLTIVVHEDFPDEDAPELRRDSCVAGWEYFINGRLKEYLAGA